MAHNNTLFAQILSLIPKNIFRSLESKHQTGRSTRQFGFKEQFTVMVFIQLAARSSLRDGIRCITAASRYLYHWGLKQVARSTVCDANRVRSFEFFQDLFARMFQMCSVQAPNHKFRFKSKFFSIDSSTISLCMSLFPWATFRRNKSGVKLHTLLDHDGHIPAFVTVTKASIHDSKFVKMFNLPKGSIVVCDKAYTDYSWFNSLNEKGIFFVIRLKSNAVYKLLERKPVTQSTGITSEHIIEINHHKDFSLRLRRIGYRDPDTNKHYVFLSNNFKLVPRTIADIYKERWKIELFFKEIKQNCRIKRFVGTSENAVMIQIYTALIVYLLLAYMKFTSKIGISVQKIFQLIQLNLLGTLTLLELLDARRKKDISDNELPLFNLSF